MKFFKKACALLSAIAVSASFVAVVHADAAKPTVYLDKTVAEDGVTMTVKVMAKNLPTEYVEGSAYNVEAATVVVDIDTAGAAGAYTVPNPPNDTAAKNKNWLTNQFKYTGYAPIVNFNKGIADTASQDNRYLVFQNAGNAADETTWLAINSDGTAELATFQLKLVDGAVYDTSINVERASVIVYNRTDEVNWSASAGDSQVAYSTLAGTADKENLALKSAAAPAEKHVEVAVKTAKGDAVNLETPNYKYSDTNGDVAVAFMATVTPNADTVNGLTWTVKSGEKTRDDLVQSFGAITGGTTISCGLIIKGISTVDSVDAVATVVSATE